MTIVNDVIEAAKNRDAEKLKGLVDLLSDDIVMSSPMGTVEGKEELLSQLGSAGEQMKAMSSGQDTSGAAKMMAKVTWGDPEEDGDQISITVTMPEDMEMPIPIKGVTIAVTFNDDDKISELELAVDM